MNENRPLKNCVWHWERLISIGANSAAIALQKTRTIDLNRAQQLMGALGVLRDVVNPFRKQNKCSRCLLRDSKVPDEIGDDFALGGGVIGRVIAGRQARLEQWLGGFLLIFYPSFHTSCAFEQGRQRLLGLLGQFVDRSSPLQF